MKQAKLIISHIINQPLFEKIEQMTSYKKLLALLPQSYQNGVKFMYNRNNTLFFVLKHNGFLMEFKYKKTDIKNILKKLIEQDKSCENINAEDIKFFVTAKTDEKIPQKANEKCIYKERSTGTFTNFAAEPKTKKLFEEIRELICKKTT